MQESKIIAKKKTLREDLDERATAITGTMLDIPTSPPIDPGATDGTKVADNENFVTDWQLTN